MYDWHRLFVVVVVVVFFHPSSRDATLWIDPIIERVLHGAFSFSQDVKQDELL